MIKRLFARLPAAGLDWVITAGKETLRRLFLFGFFRLRVLILTRAEIVLAQACSESQSVAGCFILISGSIININKTKTLFIDRLSLV